MNTTFVILIYSDISFKRKNDLKPSYSKDLKWEYIIQCLIILGSYPIMINKTVNFLSLLIYLLFLLTKYIKNFPVGRNLRYFYGCVLISGIFWLYLIYEKSENNISDSNFSLFFFITLSISYGVSSIIMQRKEIEVKKLYDNNNSPFMFFMIYEEILHQYEC